MDNENTDYTPKRRYLITAVKPDGLIESQVIFQNTITEAILCAKNTDVDWMKADVIYACFVGGNHV